MYRYHNESLVTELADDQTFVFGSNLAGVHRSRAAKTAVEYFGALNGVGRGWSGQSFAIPTTNQDLQPMPLTQIQHYVEDFKIYTRNHSQQTYFITAIGCGTTGYQPRDIAPFFKGISDNVILPARFEPFLDRNFDDMLVLRAEVLRFFCDEELIFASVEQQNLMIKDSTVLSLDEKMLIQKALAKNTQNQLTDQKNKNDIQSLEDTLGSKFVALSSENTRVFINKMLNLFEAYQINIDQFQTYWNS